MAAPLSEPGAPQDEYVGVPVVVIVGLDHVETAVEAQEPRLLGPVGEGPVRVVPEEASLPLQLHRARDDVEMVVAIEVIDDDPAGEVEGVETELGSDVLEAREVDCRPSDR